MKDDLAEYVTRMRRMFDGSILCELESQNLKIPVDNPTKLD
jgi:hypothetical protein